MQNPDVLCLSCYLSQQKHGPTIVLFIPSIIYKEHIKVVAWIQGVCFLE